MVEEKVILIGPMGTGKTSVSRILAEKLGTEYIDLDNIRWAEFANMEGYSNKEFERLFAVEPYEAFQYAKPYEAELVRVVFEKYPKGVFDFGAGYTVYEDEGLFEKVKGLFSPYKHVFCLKYSDNNEESMEALARRHDIPLELALRMNRDFIYSPCNDILAKTIIYTKGKTIDEVAGECYSELN